LSWTLATISVYLKLEKGSRPRLNIQASSDGSRVGEKGLPESFFFLVGQHLLAIREKRRKTKTT
jgi:hypothetical protein